MPKVARNFDVVDVNTEVEIAQSIPETTPDPERRPEGRALVTSGDEPPQTP